MFIAKNETSSKLSNYEIANLRGRAGRLLKDFISRTYILDELSFQENATKQLELFKDASKELEVGYGKKYQAHKEKIKKTLKIMSAAQQIIKIILFSQPICDKQF